MKDLRENVSSRNLAAVAMLVGLIAVALIVGALAACGGSSSATTVSSTEATGAETTSTTATTAAASTIFTDAGAYGNESDLERMNAYLASGQVTPGSKWAEVVSGQTSDLEGLVADLMAPVTWEGPTSSPPIAQGKHIAVIPCSMAGEGCARPAAAFIEAADKVGWETTLLDPEGDPAKLAAAYRQAVTLRVDGIFNVSNTSEQVGNALVQAREAGIEVVTQSGQEPPSPDTWSADIYERNAEMGTALAAYLGLNYPEAKILMVNDSEFNSVRDNLIAFAEGLPYYCPDCQIVDHLDFSIVDMATTMPTRVKAALLAKPEIDWVFGAYDAASGFIVPAIQQAGLSDKVHLFSWSGDPRNCDFIAKGEVQVFTVARNLEWCGYAALDQMNRLLNDQPIFEPGHENLGTKLMDKTNIPADTSGPWDGDCDFRSEYMKIWTAGEG